MLPELVGIVNVTPDSFSDGGAFLETENAVLRARDLVHDGAVVVDIGGDSTRPGSHCVGIEEEWRRIAPVLEQVAKFSVISIDTHHAEVARRAIIQGAAWINDISAGSDPAMFSVIAESDAKLVLTYTRLEAPHRFGAPAAGDIIEVAVEFLRGRVGLARAAGVHEAQLVLDPGMGAFVSEDARDSFELLRRFSELSQLELPVMLSASRKGFLRSPYEKSAKDRDSVSALLTCMVAAENGFLFPHYCRVHNVALHKQMLEAARQLTFATCRR